MTSQIRKRGGRRLDAQPEFTEVGADKIIAASHRLEGDGSRRESYQVLTLRDDKIVDIQGCSSRREAERFARRA